MLLTQHVYPSRKVGVSFLQVVVSHQWLKTEHHQLQVAITAALTLAYLVWVNIIAYYGGFWVYPVMKVAVDTGLLYHFCIRCCSRIT